MVVTTSHPMNINRLERLEEKLRLFHGPRQLKFLKAPGMYLRSTTLEWMAILLGRGIKAKADLISGDRITVMLPDLVSLALLRYGFFEEGLTRMMLDRLQPGMTFVDVGAHVGYYTLLGAWIIGDEGKVHAFEPTPSTFGLLQENTKGKSNVQLNRLAVYSSSGSLTLNDYGPRFSGCNSLYRARLNDRAFRHLRPKTYEVQSTTLDEYVFAKGISPDLIKIDAESAEYEILRGMQKTLEQFQPVISVEVGDMEVGGIPPSRDLISYLHERGYQAYDFVEGGILKHRPTDRYQHGNVLFLPAR